MQAVIFDIDETIFAGDTALHDGVQELLIILERLGVQIGAVTSGDHRMLVRLSEAGIREHFAAVLCSEHMAEPKELAGIERLLLTLQTGAHETALVSGLHSDITLGKHAGVAKTIRVNHGKTAHHELSAEADHVVDDIPAVLDVLE